MAYITCNASVLLLKDKAKKRVMAKEEGWDTHDAEGGGLEEEAAQASAQQLQQVSEQVQLSHQSSMPCERSVPPSMPSSSNFTAIDVLMFVCL